MSCAPYIRAAQRMNGSTYGYKSNAVYLLNLKKLKNNNFTAVILQTMHAGNASLGFPRQQNYYRWKRN